MCDSSKDLCAVAFSALEAYFTHTQVNPQLIAKIPDVRCPLFVTYMTLEDDLRGCIGNLGPLQLRKALPQYALIAALEDGRFDPIAA